MSKEFNFDQFEDVQVAEDQEFNFDSFADADMPERETASMEDDAEEMSAERAALSGFGQGASFGFSDEIGAAIGAPIEYAAERLGMFDPSEEDVLKGLSPEALERIKKFNVDTSPPETPRRSLEEIYDESLATQRAEIEQAQEDQPMAAMAGNIAGGMAIPGLGALGAAGKGATTLAKVGRGAAVGAGIGGVTGFGSSEGGLDERLEGAQTGAIMGGAFGGAVPAAGAGVGAVRKGLGKIGESDFGKIFKYARGGENLSEDVSKNINKLKNIGGEGVSELLDNAKAVSQSINDDLEVVAREGGRINVANLQARVLGAAEDLPDGAAKNRIYKEFQKAVNSKLDELRLRAKALGVELTPEQEQELLATGMESYNPVEAFKLIKNIKKYTGPQGSDGAERAVFGEIDQMLKEPFEEIGVGVKNKYESMSELLGKVENITGKAPSKFQSDKGKQQIRETMYKTLMEADPGAVDKTKFKEIMEGFADPIKANQTIKGLKEVAPDVAARFEEQAPEIAEKIRLGQALNGQEIRTVSRSLLGNVLAFAGGGAGLAGRAAEVTGKAIKGAGDIATSIDNNYLLGAASKLRNSGKAAHAKYADTLEKLGSLPESRKAGRIFSLMQTKGFRDAMREVQEEEDEN